jgi:aspartyl protease family protein
MSQELPHTMKVVTVWLVVGVAVFLGIQWWQHQQQQSRFHSNGGVIEIKRAADGHYHWPGDINGRPVDFLIDTGATSTAISNALASDLGLESIGQVQSDTAGGVVSGTVMRATVTLQGGVVAERLRITALPRMGDNPLLGMDVLGRLRWTQANGVLRIDTQAR